MEQDRTPDPPEPERGEHNRIGFRNVDEDAEHDERGSQGEGPEAPPRENQPGS
jgi:hypothetical protein